MNKIIQKIFILLLLIPFLFLASCDDNSDDPIDDNNDQEATLSVDEMSLLERYYYLGFDIS